MYNKMHLTILLRQDRPAHRRTPKNKIDPPGLYSALQPRRIVQLGVRTAGYLAASARLVVHPFPELQLPKARTRAAEPRGGEMR